MHTTKKIAWPCALTYAHEEILDEFNDTNCRQMDERIDMFTLLTKIISIEFQSIGRHVAACARHLPPHWRLFLVGSVVKSCQHHSTNRLKLYENGPSLE